MAKGSAWMFVSLAVLACGSESSPAPIGTAAGEQEDASDRTGRVTLDDALGKSDAAARTPDASTDMDPSDPPDAAPPDIPTERALLLAQLDAAEQLWLGQGIVDYEWHIENGCFSCFGDDASNAFIVVRSGAPSKIFGGPLFQEPVDPYPVEMARTVHTVTEFFQYLRARINVDPDYVEMRFHPDLGYPEAITIDYYDDVFDDEDFFSTHYFLDLSEVFCVESAPFRFFDDPLEVSCFSVDECSTCAAVAPRPAGCLLHYSECASDANCSEDARCMQYRAEGCFDTGSYCRALCSVEPCPPGYQCGEDEKCASISCTIDPAVCLEGERCEPDSRFANQHGCSPPTCADGGIDCGLIAECDPDDPAASQSGCVPLPCETAADCGCGSCVNQRCAIAPGSCTDPAPPELPGLAPEQQ